jgi:hypothetical protein
VYKRRWYCDTASDRLQGIAKQAAVDTAASGGQKRTRTAAIDVEHGAGEDEVLHPSLLWNTACFR